MATAPQITVLPTPPSRNDPDSFAARADEFLGKFPDTQRETNAVSTFCGSQATAAAASATSATSSATAAAQSKTDAAADRVLAQAAAASATAAPASPSTSTTSLTIGTGARTLTTQAGKLWAAGQYIMVARTSDPLTSSMLGQVTSYNSTSGALSFSVGAEGVRGSGTFTDWTITGAGPAPAGLPSATGQANNVLAVKDDGSGWEARTPANLLVKASGPVQIAGAVQQPALAVAALAIDCSTGNNFTKTVAANSAFTFTKFPAAGVDFAFKVKVIHTGGTITWPASVRWTDGVAPSLTAGKTHLFWFTTDDAGAKVFGSCLANYAS